MHKLKNIFKKRIVRKSLALLLLFGVGSVFFQSNVFNPQAVYAEPPAAAAAAAAKDGIDTQESENKLIAKTQTLNAFLKILYILLWPLLALAGLTLNNGMIYGSFFALDAPLWKFWNIMKNFANFTLGFLVLFEIIKSIFSWPGKEKESSGPMVVIRKALIAGILIQVSWFLLAAVIDISTIATYAIGGLPLSVLENNDELGNKPIMGNHSTFNLKDYEDVNKAAESFDIWYSYGQAENISKCELREGYYIIGLMNGDPAYSNEKHTSNDLELCTHGSILYAFDEHNDLKDSKTATEYAGILGDLWKTNQGDFKGDITIYKTNECPDKTDIVSLAEEPGLPPHGVNLKNCASKLLAKQRADVWLKDQRDNHDGMTMSKMLTKLEGFTGPLVTMYASLMNFAEISNVPKQGENIGAMRIEMLVKTIFALALLVPLALLCVVLLARIGVLRMVIAFMPFLILIWTFGWDDKISGSGDGGNKIMNLVGDPGKLAGLIFAPVIIVFALSISVIFMTALSNMLNDDAKQHDFFENAGMLYDKETQGINLLGVVDTHMNGNETGSDFDNIKSFSSWLFMNLFGIALVRVILFAAIKATKLGGDINKSMNADKLLGKALGAIPIMSVKGKDGKRHGVGLSALTNVVPGALDEKLTRMTSAETAALQQAINPTGTTNVTETQFRQAIQGVQSGTYKNLDEAFGSMKLDTTANAAVAQNWAAYSGVAEQMNHKISGTQISSYSRSNIEQMMNSGRIDTSGGTEVQANDKKNYHVTQTKGVLGKDHFYLTEVVDNKEDMQKSLNELHKDLREQQEKAIRADEKLNEAEKQREIADINIESKSYHSGPSSDSGTNTGGSDTGEITPPAE